jgi:hypothetical protein
VVALRSIQTGLNEACLHSRNVMYNVVIWITYAKQPLTTIEICCALAVEPCKAELYLEHKRIVYDVVFVFAGLVAVDPESAIIRLVHYTTQRYFERISSKFDSGEQLHIAKTCLTYLSFSVSEKGSCASNEEFEGRLRQHEFFDYAAIHCGEHARSGKTKITDLPGSFLDHECLLACAARVLNVPS